VDGFGLDIGEARFFDNVVKERVGFGEEVVGDTGKSLEGVLVGQPLDGLFDEAQHLERVGAGIER
jgi:hypothetical protein